VAGSGDSDRVVEGRSEPPVGVPADKFSWFQLLADTPIEQDEQDRLGFTAYADALAGLLDDPATSTPLTVAITGPWGSGKTSLAKMVEARLQRWPRERGPTLDTIHAMEVAAWPVPLAMSVGRASLGTGDPTRVLDGLDRLRPLAGVADLDHLTENLRARLVERGHVELQPPAHFGRSPPRYTVNAGADIGKDLGNSSELH
jgi:hypothetical protein